MKTIQIILLLTCCVAVLSCSRDSKTIPASSSVTPVISPTATPLASPSPPPSTAASESGDTSDIDFEGTGGVTEKKRNAKPPVTLRTVRTATHENFDRVVFEFTESAVPGYRIVYVEKPVRNCGAGEEVSVRGKAFLLIQMLPANAHTETGQVTISPEPERVLNFPVMKELKQICDFEADVQWILGVASPKHYRVIELLNPARLVVDVKH